MGFVLPVGILFIIELKDFLSETLISKSSLNRGYFRPEAIKDMIKQHIGKRADFTMQLWSLLMLELWHQRFID